MGIGHAERARLESLRYATVPEAAEYLAIMRAFTSDIAGLLSTYLAFPVPAAAMVIFGSGLAVGVLDPLGWLAGRPRCRVLG